MGAYHTVLLEMNRQFTLNKEEWDSITLERIGEISLSFPPLGVLGNTNPLHRLYSVTYYMP